MAMKNKLLQSGTAKPAPMSPPRNTDDMDRERQYRAREALDTIARAEAHKKDRALMKDVQMLAKRNMAAVCPPKKK